MGRGRFEFSHVANIKSGRGPILPEVTIENRSTTLNRLSNPVNRRACKVQNLLQPFEVGNYHLLAISSTNNRKNYQFHNLTVFHSMSKDGRKMSPMHVTLKAGVNVLVLNAMLDFTRAFEM